jgi:ribosomal protein L11 methyltransferase
VLLGAAPVDATDVDGQALRATRANASANKVDVRCCTPGDLPRRRYDIVVANILANPLKLLAELLVARCAPNGWLVIAGLLDRQVEEMQARYRAVEPRLRLEPWRALDGWTCLAGRLPSAARDTSAKH